VQGLPIQSELLHGGWAKRGEQHIGLGQFPVQGLLSLFRLQVHVGNSHAGLQCVVCAAVVKAHGVPRCAFWGARVGRGLQLDAGCPHLLAAHQSRGTGQVQRQTEDAHAL